MGEEKFENYEEKETATLVKKKSALALVGMILSIIGLCTSFIPIVNYISLFLGILAIILGIIAIIKKEIKITSVIALVLGIASIAIAICIQIQFMRKIDQFMYKVDDAVNEFMELNDALDYMTGEKTEDILKNNLSVDFGKIKITNNSFLFSATIPVNVKNKGSNSNSFHILIEAVDSDGNVIAYDSIQTDNLRPGESQRFELFTVNTNTIDKFRSLRTAEFNIVEVSMY